MTGIVKDSLSNEFFDSLNRIHDAKNSGALQSSEFSKLLILENKFFANMVRKGLKTEEDVETYENHLMPVGEYPHDDLNVAFSSIKQANTAALFDRENMLKQTQPVKRM